MSDMMSHRPPLALLQLITLTIPDPRGGLLKRESKKNVGLANKNISIYDN